VNKSWEEVWPDIETAVRVSETRGEAVSKASKILGRQITYDALQRSWKRQTGVSILQALGAKERQPDPLERLAVDYANNGYTFATHYNDVPPEPEPPSRTPPWLKAPRVYNQDKELRILVVPDTQVMPGVALTHFTALGRYAVAKRPDIIIHLGDFLDMPSLSSYESAVRKAHVGRCKVADLESGNRAIEMFETELAKAQGYSPRRIMLEGNHDSFGEHGRIGRYLAEHPDDRRLIEKVELLPAKCGWEIIPFLEPIEVQGVLYCHLFPYSAKGTVTSGSLRMGASSASAQVKAVMKSATAGHKQGLDVAILNTPHSTHRGLVAGSFYQHTDDYMPGARFWRGCLLKTEAKDGTYGLVEVSIEFLLRRYL
jgi:hypothetical protein